MLLTRWSTSFAPSKRSATMVPGRMAISASRTDAFGRRASAPVDVDLTIYRNEKPSKVVQDFATIHSIILNTEKWWMLGLPSFFESRFSGFGKSTRRADFVPRLGIWVCVSAALSNSLLYTSELAERLRNSCGSRNCGFPWDLVEFGG